METRLSQGACFTHLALVQLACFIAMSHVVPLGMTVLICIVSSFALASFAHSDISAYAMVLLTISACIPFFLIISPNQSEIADPRVSDATLLFQALVAAMGFLNFARTLKNSKRFALQDLFMLTLAVSIGCLTVTWANKLMFRFAYDSFAIMMVCLTISMVGIGRCLTVYPRRTMA